MRSVTISRAYADRTQKRYTMYIDQGTDQNVHVERDKNKKAVMEQIYLWIRRGSPLHPQFSVSKLRCTKVSYCLYPFQIDCPFLTTIIVKALSPNCQK